MDGRGRPPTDVRLSLIETVWGRISMPCRNAEQCIPRQVTMDQGRKNSLTNPGSLAADLGLQAAPDAPSASRPRHTHVNQLAVSSQPSYVHPT